MSLITVITAGESPVGLSVEPARVVVDDADHWHRAAVAVCCGSDRLLVLFTTPRTGPGDAGGGDRRSLQRLPLANGEFVTDARVALLAVSPDGVPLPLALVDASEARWTGRGGLQTVPGAARSVWGYRRDASERLGGSDAQPRRA